MQLWRHYTAGLCLTLLGGAAAAQGIPPGFPCQPVTCSTLLPATVADPNTNDCAYRAGNLWWVDYVAGSLAWSEHGRAPRPVTVAVFDDGAWIDHEDLRNQLWTNEAEAHGKPGVDDDGNGYVDDVHGWDFVDNSPDVSPKGACRDRVSHGTMMASLVAAERNNRVGIAAPGSDGARVMILRIVGCDESTTRVDPARLIRALQYATRMGARILSFSAHWSVTTPELDAAFREIANTPGSPVAAIVVASVPNRGEPEAGYPAAYDFSRIVRAIPIGNDDEISPGTSPAPPGLNLGSPSACVIGAGRSPSQYRLEQGSSNSTAILAGLLAGIWSSPRYAKLSPDEFLAGVVEGRMSKTERRSKPGLRPPYLEGVPLADACLLASEPGRPMGQRHSASVCRQPEAHREARP
jgi:subtilisin family serine protease